MSYEVEKVARSLFLLARLASLAWAAVRRIEFGKAEIASSGVKPESSE